jgi:hypothetical protein
LLGVNFLALVGTLPEKKSSQLWLQARIKERSPDYLVSAFEADGRIPKPENFDPNQVIRWFASLMASMDAYVWMLSHEMVKATEIFSTEGKSRMIPKIYFFTTNFALISKKHQSFAEQSPSEMENFQKSKSDVVLRMLKMVLVLVEKHDFASYLTKIFDDKFFKLIFKCVLSPSSVGFQTSEGKSIKSLGKILTKLCTYFSRSFSEESRQGKIMRDVLRKIISKEKTNILDLDLGHGTMNVDLSCKLASGYMLFQTCNLQTTFSAAISATKNTLAIPATNSSKSSKTVNSPAEKIAATLAQQIYENCNVYDPVEIVGAGKVFESALFLGPTAVPLLNYLLVKKKIKF